MVYATNGITIANAMMTAEGTKQANGNKGFKNFAKPAGEAYLLCRSCNFSFFMKSGKNSEKSNKRGKTNLIKTKDRDMIKNFSL